MLAEAAPAFVVRRSPPVRRAWVTRKIGTSEISRGVEIHVIRSHLTKAELGPVIAFLRSQPRTAPSADSYDGFPEGYFVRPEGGLGPAPIGSSAGIESPNSEDRFNSLVRETFWGRVVGSAKIASATTNIDGKYAIEGLKGGRYYAYARIDNDVFFIEWPSPRTDRPGRFAFDFHNGNAAVIQNRFDGGEKARVPDVPVQPIESDTVFPRSSRIAPSTRACRGRSTETVRAAEGLQCRGGPEADRDPGRCRMPV